MILWVDGAEVISDLRPRQTKAGIEIPIKVFSDAIHAEIKEPEVGGTIALCRGDLCVPIVPGSRRMVDGHAYVPLDIFGNAFGLQWTSNDKELRVNTKGIRKSEGLGIGQIAPGFTLPDMYTGEPVSSEAFRRRKSVFFMWASW